LAPYIDPFLDFTANMPVQISKGIKQEATRQIFQLKIKPRMIPLMMELVYSIMDEISSVETPLRILISDERTIVKTPAEFSLLSNHEIGFLSKDSYNIILTFLVIDSPRIPKINQARVGMIK